MEGKEKVKLRKEKWMKKLISLLMAVCLLLSSVPMLGTVSVQASEEFRADDNLLAHYPLESDAKDVSGNDQDAVITEGASGVSFTGDALNLAGGDKNSKNYVTLPDGLFVESFTPFSVVHGEPAFTESVNTAL